VIRGEHGDDGSDPSPVVGDPEVFGQLAVDAVDGSDRAAVADL